MKKEKRRCTSCTFFAAEKDGGRCRKSAPHALINLMTNVNEVAAVWPRVANDDWCGEWQSR